MSSSNEIGWAVVVMPGYAVCAMRESDEVFMLEPVGVIATVPYMFAKNNQNYWWYCREYNKEWVPVYLRASEYVPACYFLTTIKEGSMGLFRGMISGLYVGPYWNTYQEPVQWSFLNFTDDIEANKIAVGVPQKHYTALHVQFIKKQHYEPVELSYHTNPTTKNAATRL